MSNAPKKRPSFLASIELRDLKILEESSEDTHCFYAKLYYKGRFAFYASNNGSGEYNRYAPACSGIPKPKDNKRMRETIEDLNGEGADLGLDTDSIVSLLISECLELKEITNQCRRNVMFLDGDSIKSCKIPKGKSPTSLWMTHLSSRFPRAISLNFSSTAIRLNALYTAGILSA